jgi:hypothetical protein
MMLSRVLASTYQATDEVDVQKEEKEYIVKIIFNIHAHVSSRAFYASSTQGASDDLTIKRHKTF